MFIEVITIGNEKKLINPKLIEEIESEICADGSSMLKVRFVSGEVKLLQHTQDDFNQMCSQLTTAEGAILEQGANNFRQFVASQQRVILPS